MLVLSQYWLADGTFKTAADLFSQVYVIHALRGGPDPTQNGNLLPSLFVPLPKQIAGYLHEDVATGQSALSKLPTYPDDDGF